MNLLKLQIQRFDAMFDDAHEFMKHVVMQRSVMTNSFFIFAAKQSLRVSV